MGRIDLAQVLVQFVALTCEEAADQPLKLLRLGGETNLLGELLLLDLFEDAGGDPEQGRRILVGALVQDAKAGG